MWVDLSHHNSACENLLFAFQFLKGGQDALDYPRHVPGISVPVVLIVQYLNKRQSTTLVLPGWKFFYASQQPLSY